MNFALRHTGLTTLLMMLDFLIGTGLEHEGVVGLDQDSWRMPDRLGCGRIAAMLVCRLC